MQCDAVCCSVLQCVAVCCGVCCIVVKCVPMCCGVLQCVVVCCNVLLCGAVCCSVCQCCAVCCSVLQWVAVSCSVLQCVAVRCSALQCDKLCYMRRDASLKKISFALTSTHTHTRTHTKLYLSRLRPLFVRRNTQWHTVIRATYCNTSRGTECCRVLQCVAVCRSVLQCVAVCCSVLHLLSSVRVMSRSLCCSASSVLQCVTVSCSVLQRVAACCNVPKCATCVGALPLSLPPSFLCTCDTSFALSLALSLVLSFSCARFILHTATAPLSLFLALSSIHSLFDFLSHARTCACTRAHSPSIYFSLVIPPSFSLSLSRCLTHSQVCSLPFSCCNVSTSAFFW